MITKFLKKIDDNMKSLKAIDWAIGVAIIVFSYFSFNHEDIMITATHGMDLLRCIISGNFLEFYDYTMGTAYYLIPTYLIFAVWSIVPMIVFRLAGIPLWGVIEYDAISYPLLMWYKLLPTLFFIGIAIIVYRIIKEMNIDDKLAKTAAFLWVTSPIAMFSQFVFGQYDAIGLFFLMLSLLFYIQGKYYKFSMVMSIAITFKMFPIFIFVPLILLVEKRITRIIVHFVIATIGYGFVNVIFMNSEAFRKVAQFNKGIVWIFTSSTIPSAFSATSIFILAVMAICVIAYETRVEAHKDINVYAIYICLFVYSFLFAFVYWHPQWVIMLVPFLAIATVMNKHMNATIILDIVMGIGYIVSSVVNFKGNVDANLILKGFWSKLHTVSKDLTIADKFSLGGLIDNSVYMTMFVGSILIILVMYFPFRKKVEVNTELQIQRLYLWVRLGVIMIYIIPTIVLYFG